MGKHFDTFVELTRELAKSRSGLPNVPSFDKSLGHYADYLESVVRDAVLFELPITPQQLYQGRNDQEYIEYLHDYLNESAKHGAFFLTPFDLAAIEYPESVTLVQKRAQQNYQVMTCTTANSIRTAVYSTVSKVKYRKISSTAPS